MPGEEPPSWCAAVWRGCETAVERQGSPGHGDAARQVQGCAESQRQAADKIGCGDREEETL